jgi:hypothetical protein
MNCVESETAYASQVRIATLMRATLRIAQNWPPASLRLARAMTPLRAVVPQDNIRMVLDRGRWAVLLTLMGMAAD